MPRRGDQRGESLVEFALASSVLLLLILGTMQFGLAIWNYNTIASLAQDGARWAAVRGTNCTSPCVKATSDNVRTYVRGRVLGMSPASVSVDTTWPDGDNGVGNTVQVRVSYSFTHFSQILPRRLLSLGATAQMKIAH
jgi:Flp pilus assembly protein TadG